MPKLWDDTISSHRRQVREAILDTTWRLAAERGPSGVTMSQVAETAGIGRATLYKYFPDVESILAAWHERQITRHIELLAHTRDAADPADRLRAVLAGYADLHRRRARHEQTPRGAELAALLHTDETVATAQRRLRDLIRDILADAATTGLARSDPAPDELAGYCLFALAAASTADTDAEVARLVDLTLTAIRPPIDHT